MPTSHPLDTTVSHPVITTTTMVTIGNMPRTSGATCLLLLFACGGWDQAWFTQRHQLVAAFHAVGRRQSSVNILERGFPSLPPLQSRAIRSCWHSSSPSSSKVYMISPSKRSSRRPRKKTRISTSSLVKPSGEQEEEANSTHPSWLSSSFQRDNDGTSTINGVDDGYYDAVEEAGSVHIPSGGMSVSDAMEASQQDRFVTTLLPIETLPEGSAAQILTSSTTSGAIEPVRYLVALSPPDPGRREDDSVKPSFGTRATEYCLVDVPPYSPQLMEQMQSFMKSSGGRVSLIVVTSRDAIHYDSASSTDYATLVRKSDLHKWTDALGAGSVDVVTYRLDTPRDCRDIVTQVLDGYGPFALADNDDQPCDAKPKRSLPFKETGRPLTVQEWDFNVAQNVLSGKQVPPDDRERLDSETTTDPSEVLYTPEAIRERELGKRLVAVYTPGHTYGSVAYVFPDVGVCCSGFTIPIEASREGIDEFNTSAGPTLDCRGYITTSQAGIARQMESARNLVEQYGDRFETVLPSRGDPLLWLPTSAKERKRLLLDLIQQFEKIGKVYEELGITLSSSSGDDGNRS